MIAHLRSSLIALTSFPLPASDRADLAPPIRSSPERCSCLSAFFRRAAGKLPAGKPPFAGQHHASDGYRFLEPVSSPSSSSVGAGVSMYVRDRDRHIGRWHSGSGRVGRLPSDGQPRSARIHRQHSRPGRFHRFSTSARREGCCAHVPRRWEAPLGSGHRRSGISSLRSIASDAPRAVRHKPCRRTVHVSADE